MRKGWEYKRFDEVFDLQMGKTPDRKNPEYFGGNNVWVSIRDLGDKEIADSNEHITDLAVSNSNIRKVKKGTVIMSFKLTVGKCGIAATDLYTNEAIMAFNTKECYDINSSFLYYYLQCYHWVGSNKAVMGITLNKATISKQNISIPPKSTQLAIVSELDKINELIRLKKEQLKDFDNLAQSLFYEMFGDPVENEKGWEVKKLGEVCIYPNKRIQVTELNPQDYVGVENLQKNRAGIVFSDKIPNTDSAIAFSPNDILIGNIRPYLKKIWLADKNGGASGDVVIIRICTNDLLPMYLYKVLASDQFFEYDNTYTKGAKMPRGDRKAIAKFMVPLPPLSLQRLFAQRVEQIEREKTEVQKSIQDLETLLASRMQYWFE